MTDIAGLYHAYASSVYRFALYLTGDRALAEDITSETFVRAWTARAAIDTTTVKAYLFTIARHLYLHGLRRTRRDTALEDTLPDTAAGPHAAAVAKQEFERVRAGLLALPEVDRAALLMRALDELPYDEIARALGLSLSSVKVKIHRARTALRRVREGASRERD